MKLSEIKLVVLKSETQNEWVAVQNILMLNKWEPFGDMCDSFKKYPFTKIYDDRQYINTRFPGGTTIRASEFIAANTPNEADRTTNLNTVTTESANV